METPLRILLIDDSPDDRSLASRALLREFESATVREVANSEELTRALAAGDFDAVVTDYHLRWSDGLAVLRQVRELYAGLPVIMFTGTGSEEIAVAAMKNGLDDYIIKTPQHYVRLPAAVRNAVERAAVRGRAAQAENRLQRLLDRLDLGIVRTDASGRILEANGAFVRTMGFAGLEEALGTDLVALLADQGDLANLTERLAGGNAVDLRVRLRRLDGTPIWCSLSVARTTLPTGGEVLDAVIEDITERHTLELQLLQSQKMEGVGRLAGGVAHDFNNLLTAILSYSELLDEELPENQPGRESLAEIRQAAERAANLTRQLLAFSRRQIVEPRSVDLNELARDLEKMLRRLIGEDIELLTRLAPELQTVHVDPGQIDQVILNLVVNARDAMPEGGRITIETSNVEVSPGDARVRPEMPAGEYVLLAVSDTGHGMGEEVMRHLFEPYFTTKAQGKGTGLGLPTCYGIVKQAGGFIWIYSEPGEGTVVKVYLPPSDAPATQRLRPLAQQRELSGTETILVAEDDPLVRNLAVHVLRGRGYRVLAAADGSEALAVARAEPGPIELLFTDVVMPGLRGWELAERLREERPDIRVLFTSGYTADGIVNAGVLEAGVALISKPFTPATLSLRVREALDG